MLAFVVAGLILGALARYLRQGPEDPSLLLTLVLGVVGGVVGGVALNIFLDESVTDLNAWSFTGACVLALVLLGLVEGRAGSAGRAGRGR